MIKAYYTLAKPGIIYGNAITAIGGFFLASKGHFHFGLFLAMLAGISLVMGSACAFNNYLDREIDKRMERTKKRALIQGTISPRNALIYGTVLGLLGALVLARGTNLLTLWIALTGFLIYVVLYGLGKRHSVHGTLVGSLAGAVPPVVGYCAVNQRFDGGAWWLLLILVLWQMPHFYAIAIYRLADYQAADLPVLPAVKGIPATKNQIMAYVLAFILASLGLYFFGYAGIIYLIGMALLDLAWLRLGIKGWKAPDQVAWARKIFRFSLIVLTGFSVLIAVNPT